MKITEIDLPNVQHKEVRLFKLTNGEETEVTITNIGATITSIKTKDKEGNLSDIVLGFDTPEEYISKEYLGNCIFLGATVGRFANRISKGKFELDGKTYKLRKNNGNNHLHGGPTGFHQKIWNARIEDTDAGQTLVMTLTSPDKEEGYPGKVEVEVRFFLSNENELIIDYNAQSDTPTPVNLTNHSYFNLSGKVTDILNHEVMIFADEYTPKIDDIPIGDIVPTKDTPFDFQDFRKVGERLNHLPEEAYDHNLVISGDEGDLRRAAIAKEPESGRTLEVYTTLPGMQFYTGYFLDGTYGNSKRKFDQFSGMCFETQYFPDSPNHKAFPSCIVTPDNPFNHTTVFKFTVE
ncbi:aldose epimerase family protein [Marinilabilia rubra]|uniref:Aldose 1-epimerase n=1 Tax=Marinilabilia rubra TaxID=2162893 RepID=A0A2U2B3H9_9BACT|nr:aldose epimerase family protein [Marinilabilia rubra]PWD97587.1 galactose-1-epimerase [Marinilabilia rubra]